MTETLPEVLTINQQIKIECDNRPIIVTVDAIWPDCFAVRESNHGSERQEVRIGTRARGTFLKENLVCSFESKILSRDRDSSRISLSWPKAITLEQVKCYQRSGFTGIEGYIPFRYEPVSKGAEITFSKQGVATWIGGDELTMVSVIEPPRGSVLALEIQQPVSPSPLRVFARVHKVKSHGSLFHARLVFQAISEKDRDTILKHVLQKQAQLNRAGLLAPRGKI